MCMTYDTHDPTDSYQIEDTPEFANYEDADETAALVLADAERDLRMGRWYANALEGGGEQSAPTLGHMIIDAFAAARDARGLDPWTEADRYPELDSWNPSALHPYAA